MRRFILLSLGLLAVLSCIHWGGTLARQARLNGELVGAVYPPANPIDSDRVKELLDVGANPNAKGPKDVMVLSWAANAGDITTMKVLLDAGADPDCRGGWLPALNMAAGRGHLDVARLLLDRGADPNNHRLGDGSWALGIARSHGDRKVERLLLSRGARPPVDR